MITKIITLSSFIFILCCNNIELVLEDNNSAQQLKNNIFKERRRMEIKIERNLQRA